MRDGLLKSQKIVIKAGTSMLTGKNGKFSKLCMRRLGTQIGEVVRSGRETVLVSSGAIAFGMEALGYESRPKTMPELQACAAIGQGKLMHAYEQFFSKTGLLTAQLLLTRDGLETRTRFLSARHTLGTLIDMKDAAGRMRVVPIINENDTIATEEIAFGDNDILAVHAAHLIQADLLIILSDVDGFYLRDGSRIRQVPSIREIDTELVKHLKDTKKQKTVGGMRAKLKAAKTAMSLGISLLIVNGHDDDVILKALRGEDVGTLFVSGKDVESARKKWIAFSAARQGSIVVDQGAYEALRHKKKSLLPPGMVKVRGEFGRGEVVELETADGKVFGRGMVRYSSKELSRLAGKKTDEIEAVLGYKVQDEIIHRNDLVIWD